MASFKINLRDYLSGGGLVKNLNLNYVLVDSIYSPNSIELKDNETCYVKFGKKKKAIPTYNIDVFVTAELDQSYKI